MTLTLNGPTLNANMPMERAYSTFYLLPTALFAESVTSGEIFSEEMCITLTYRMGQGPIERIRATLYSWLTMYVVYVTVCEIITRELPSVLE